MKKLFIPFIILSFVRCANPVGPTGGDKDINPPIIQKIKTLQLKDEKSVTIIFDENINTKGSLILSPITTKKNIEITKYRNTIEFKVPQTTNSISLSDIITDVNENNPGKYPFIILGKDSHQYTLKYKSLNPTKDKIKSYALIDSFFYYSDNSQKNILNYGGLKNRDQTIYIFNDINNNDKYDINEEYNILQIDKNKLVSFRDTLRDTTSIYLYPSAQKEIKRSINLKDSLAVYTQIPQFFIAQEKQKEVAFILEHNDTLIVNILDTNYIDEQIKSHLGNIKIIPSKIEINQNGNSIPKLGIFENDTIIKFEYCLAPFYKNIISKEFFIPNSKQIKDAQSISLKNKNIKSIYDNLTYRNIRETTTKKYLTTGYSQNKKDSIYKKIKIKLGKTIVKIKGNQNDSLKIKFINEQKKEFIFTLNQKENEIILETGNYRYIIWHDSNSNNQIDIDTSHINYKHERIQEYMRETAVNSKLDNIILVE